ncbi:c-type cytochrome [Caldimonas sp. KR1-144]|uniref:c-type cytochrome n=1 Tax=Caldimonas sp. KR1-144 TaxID=3400911 RepID=UPI003C05F9D9
MIVRSAFVTLALALVGAGAGAAAPADPKLDTMAQRLQACTACHGKEGRATPEGYFPRIAGKPAGYLYNQLLNFRDGRRRNATMTYFVEHLSDDYLREIAAYFASLDLPYAPPAVSQAAAQPIEQGRRLVHEGDAARGIPACVKCHGASMTGLSPSMPGLLGLPHAYLVGQLGAWRDGQRRAVEPDCMGEIARKLSAQEVNAVAVWLASQPVPADAKAPPLPAGTKLPLECGSGGR